jgi:threonine/homoserine/homoserine lactone efflux protein
MIEALIQGIGLGLLLSILVGPVFFLLIKISIEKGVKEALILDIGVLAGDFFIIWLCYLGTADIFKNVEYAKILGYIGSGILITVGITPFFQKARTESKDLSIKGKTNMPLLMIKGFVLNITNPFVIFFWIASVGYAVTTFDALPAPIFIYFVACMITYLIVDLGKIYGAMSIKKHLTPKTILTINRFASAGVILLGIIMLIRVYHM